MYLSPCLNERNISLIAIFPESQNAEPPEIINNRGHKRIETRTKIFNP